MLEVKQLYRSNLERREHLAFLVRIGRKSITISPIKLYSIYKYIPPYLNFLSEIYYSMWLENPTCYPFEGTILSNFSQLDITLTSP